MVLFAPAFGRFLTHPSSLDEQENAQKERSSSTLRSESLWDGTKHISPEAAMHVVHWKASRRVNLSLGARLVDSFFFSRRLASLIHYGSCWRFTTFFQSKGGTRNVWIVA